MIRITSRHLRKMIQEAAQNVEPIRLTQAQLRNVIKEAVLNEWEIPAFTKKGREDQNVRKQGNLLKKDISELVPWEGTDSTINTRDPKLVSAYAKDPDGMRSKISSMVIKTPADRDLERKARAIFFLAFEACFGVHIDSTSNAMMSLGDDACEKIDSMNDWQQIVSFGRSIIRSK